jgi:group I intron endonuclease
MKGIYKIQCLQEDTCYIGSSKDIVNRWNYHKSSLNRGNHTNERLQLAWDAYGDESFTFLILEETDNLVVQEQFWIDKDTNKLYNISNSAWNPMRSPEVVAKVLATKMRIHGKVSQNQKLNDNIVKDIINDINNGAKIDNILANKYNISRKAIYNIKIGHTWKHLHHLIIDKRSAAEVKQDLFNVAIELRKAGMSKWQIAKELDVSNMTLYNWGLK